MPPNERNIILLIIYWPLYIHYLYILYYLHLQRRRSHWSRIQKQPPGVFLRTSQISLESTCVGVSKKRFLRSCFPVKFEKFFRAPTLKSIYKRLLLFTDYFSIYWFIQFTTEYVFHFYVELLLYYATKTIELMTHEAVSFEKVFHWTKFSAFER